MQSFVKFINHASILISNGKKGILTDPWYSGSVFDDGWMLLYENEKKEIEKILKDVNFIWISHEHPDHFSIKFINEYQEIIKERNIEFIFQNTKDKRVVSFLKSKKFKFIELNDNKPFSIDKNFTIKIHKCDFYDSALIVKIDDKKLFNLNDCPLKTKSQINDFKKIYGSCDFLFTQFSYAAWKGGKNNISWRKSAAKEKIQTLKYQSEILNSKFTIPFASFIKFSNNYNFYLNDAINTPKDIIDNCSNIESNLSFLKPYQVIELENPKNETEGYDFWRRIYEDKSNFNIIENSKFYDFNTLKEAFNLYQKRIFTKNSEYLIKSISKLKFLNFFQPIIIELRDIKINVKVDLANKIFEEVNDEPDIEMNSKSLYLIFNQDFGFDTLTVNGCFEEKKKHSFSKMSKIFSIGNLNNLGFNLNLSIFFNISLISLFFKKLLYVKRKLG